MAAIYVVAAAVTCFKLLLIPSYRSTDFEVHRNWLAITHSLPIRQWYTDKTSEWTLDYPPLFAWMEFFLSQIAKHFDPEMLRVKNLNYASDATILFQRLTVIVTDFMYLFAAKKFCDVCVKKTKGKESASSNIYQNPSLIMAVLLMANFGLLIVDHIHFQYNGVLMGIFILSIVCIYQNKFIQSALWFSILLNMKHIYLYVAPVYFVYLLRCYCYNPNKQGSKFSISSFSPLRLIYLGMIVLTVFGISFGPFIYMGQLSQVLSRLFPFKRGLCHAYWAPNVWALYNIADKAASIIGTKLKLLSSIAVEEASMTGGLVQEFSHTVLPSIKPIYTVILTLIAMLPALIHLFLNPQKGGQGFVRCLVLCGFASFLFGWHVHEKAILIIIIPLTLLILEKREDGRLYLFLSTIGFYSLFPLLFTQFETPIKIVLLILHCLYSFSSLSNIYRSPSSILPVVSWYESLYLLGIIPLELYNSFIHHVLKLNITLPFIPLLLTSVYCSIGVLYAWLRFYSTTLKSSTHKTKTS
ncbi:probable dolichyl pyrophosphate Glc1Man9GlcNAc2 alpha-1,3-glucosyltransferase isoform X1 [Patella vulgata]|uniref:probable dolichyl pyrophosphate Glc1Man9GlcNAc2 alpha-1,3-glucosyltransferase isoform X1 n=3 Tax=Patella vulgata TaxID=6465 RepID=UPI0024A9FF8A|nr:probable dolichyl pyrophosphate Glc1Man9GlcNAc2 alpha-1,3-glucosyltransferase isoform X1 [Patella vulgata]